MMAIAGRSGFPLSTGELRGESSRIGARWMVITDIRRLSNLKWVFSESMPQSPNAPPAPNDSTSALKIVHYLPAILLKDGGIVRAIIDWCEVLTKRGHRVILLTCDAADVPANWREGLAHKPAVVVLPDLTSHAADAALEEVIAAADALHLHGPWTRGNRQLSKLAGRLGVPCVVSIHGMLDDWSMHQKSLKKRVYMSLFGRRFLDGAAC